MTDKNNYQKTNDNRKSGILMHISSLPGPYGIGSLGDNARHFIDLLVESGQSYWQVLPIGPTSYGDSPYQSFSTFAGNPYFISLEYLKNEGLLYQEELDIISESYNSNYIDYERLYYERYPILMKAFDRFDLNNKEFKQFCEKQGFWLNHYSLFMALKDFHNGDSWIKWETKYKNRDEYAISEFISNHEEKINFNKFVQFKFYQQWIDLRNYANSKNIEIIGDIPIYVAEDSSDVWGNPQLFKLNYNLTPAFVGGCPPDVFSDTGQLWGNPVYDWNANKAQDYKWWIERIKASFNFFDIIRIDHFRGFESYWEIPTESETAASGKWMKGPGYDLFKKIKEVLGELPIIAEDLGYMTKEVYEFRQQTAFPGMKIIQFAFNDDMNSEHMPHNYTKDFIVYPGTHDNETLGGWLENISKTNIFERIKDYANLTSEEGYNWGIIRICMNSTAKTAIFQIQDLLNLGNEARMNKPSTIGNNWKWRLPIFPSKELFNKLYKYTKNSARLNKLNG